MDNAENKYKHLSGITNSQKFEMKGEVETPKKATFNNRTIQSHIKDDRNNSINAKDKRSSKV